MQQPVFKKFISFIAAYAFIFASMTASSFNCITTPDTFDPAIDTVDDATLISRPHPVIGNYHVYYGSFHNHSNVSDGQGTPYEAYRYAKYKAGLDFFSLSDHDINLLNDDNWNTLKATADAANKDGAFAAFWAFEWTNFDYHLTVINTDTFCINQSEETYSLQSLCTWLDAHNGIAILNHVFIVDFHGTEFNDFNGSVYEKIVGMELFNQNDPFSFYYYNDGYDTNDNNKGVFDEALTRGFKMGAAGGFDNHLATWGTANDFRLAILAENLTRADLFAAMQARRFFSTLDKNIALSFTIGGNEMGSTITSGNSALEIHVSDVDREYFTEVFLFDKNHATRRLWKLKTTSVTITDTLNIASGDYYYIKVTQKDGDEAISSPIWVLDSVTVDTSSH